MNKLFSFARWLYLLVFRPSALMPKELPIETEVVCDDSKQFTNGPYREMAIVPVQTETSVAPPLPDQPVTQVGDWVIIETRPAEPDDRVIP